MIVYMIQYLQSEVSGYADQFYLAERIRISDIRRGSATLNSRPFSRFPRGRWDKKSEYRVTSLSLPVIIAQKCHPPAVVTGIK